MNIDFLKYRKLYFIFSGLTVLAGLMCLFVFGLKPGIDFTGGSILEAVYITERPDNQTIRESLSEFNLGDFSIQPTDEKGILLKMGSINEQTHQEILEKLREAGDFEEIRFESIGPTIGRELREKTNIVIILSLIVIVLYITFAFRKVSRPVTSWQYSITSLIALFHDGLIPLGAFALLGKFYDIQITIPVVVALITVLGYSINNTVVVFDRIRENLLRGYRESFEEIINASLNQTLTRQINTSLTTLFPLVAIFFLGGETLKYFALTLIIGIGAGTYSSIFLAGPILAAWLSRRS